MHHWKKAILLSCITLMMASPAMAAGAEKAASEFTYYKAGIFLKPPGTVMADEQGFHFHGKIANKYNILGIRAYKYSQQFDMVLWKIIGLLEIAQDELP